MNPKYLNSNLLFDKTYKFLQKYDFPKKIVRWYHFNGEVILPNGSKIQKQSTRKQK